MHEHRTRIRKKKKAFNHHKATKDAEDYFEYIKEESAVNNQGASNLTF